MSVKSYGVVVAHDDRRVIEAISERLEALPDLFVAGTTPDAARPGHILVAGGEPLVAMERGAHPLVALAEGDALRAARAAIAAGAADIVRWPEEAERLPGAIRRAAAHARGESGGGKLIAIAGARGGVGTTTIAAALASAFSDALVVDLDTTGAGQRAFTGEEPVRTLLDLSLRDVGGDGLQQAAVAHAGGARALHARARSEPIGAADAHGLLRAAREAAAVCVIDCGRAAGPGARAAFARADVRLLVCSNDVASMRAVSDMRAELEGARFILRRVRRAGVALRDVEAATGQRPLAVLREDRALARAVDLGTLPSAKNKTMRALRRVARDLRQGWA